MLQLVGDIVKYFSFDEINIDNWVFKLYYKGCFVLFLLGSMVGIVSQYFGEPINCDFKVRNDMAGVQLDRIRAFHCVVFNSGQKMALIALYVVICWSFC